MGPGKSETPSRLRWLVRWLTLFLRHWEWRLNVQRLFWCSVTPKCCDGKCLKQPLTSVSKYRSGDVIEKAERGSANSTRLTFPSFRLRCSHTRVPIRTNSRRAGMLGNKSPIPILGMPPAFVSEFDCFQL